jgi:ABC-type Fe3+ transport system permease subunit
VLIYYTTSLPIEIPELMSAKQALATKKEHLKQMRFWGSLLILAVQCIFFIAYSIVFKKSCNGTESTSSSTEYAQYLWIRFANGIYYGMIGCTLAILFIIYWRKFRVSLPDDSLTEVTNRRVSIVITTGLCQMQY